MKRLHSTFLLSFTLTVKFILCSICPWAEVLKSNVLKILLLEKENGKLLSGQNDSAVALWFSHIQTWFRKRLQAIPGACLMLPLAPHGRGFPVLSVTEVDSESTLCCFFFGDNYKLLVVAVCRMQYVNSAANPTLLGRVRMKTIKSVIFQLCSHLEHPIILLFSKKGRNGAE